MKNIIFIAPPAAGKGTMSSLLEAKYNYVHISTGDLLRDAKSENNELGTKLKEMLGSGKLVPDNIVLDLLYNRIKIEDKTHSFILDGYPRNRSQVDSLMNIFKELDINDFIGVYLDCDYEEAMKRTLGRLVCPNCKRSFNKFKTATKPKVEGICDNCGSVLETRNDDTEETFKVRYQSYMNETKPVIDYFQSINRLVTVKSTDNPDEMLKEIEKYLEV
ncbi:MAG: nucleoside monophosphate kinase [bacterium]|nr:nucleoside monophosphate kinase [bacterium]